MTFGQALKTINSEWDFDIANDTQDIKGNKYKTFYIKSGDARCPTLAECLAIADYLGMRYHKGYFYKEVL